MRSYERLSAVQQTELAQIVETGPNLTAAGVMRWRRVDLQRVIEERFGVVYHERTIDKFEVSIWVDLHY